jgi:hypothetical protein
MGLGSFFVLLFLFIELSGNTESIQQMKSDTAFTGRSEVCSALGWARVAVHVFIIFSNYRK